MNPLIFYSSKPVYTGKAQPRAPFIVDPVRVMQLASAIVGGGGHSARRRLNLVAAELQAEAETARRIA
jgi:hypothetical protein